MDIPPVKSGNIPASWSPLSASLPIFLLCSPVQTENALGTRPHFLHFLSYLWERKITLIVPVPLHSRRKRKRGFNQAEIVAKVLSENTEIAMEAGAVKRIKATIPQKDLGDKGRKRNIRGAFTVQKNVKGENIVLIDDIYTTGSTLDEAARVLKKAGAENVYFLTVSIGQGI